MSAMRYWLMKTEPEAYSIDDLERDGRTYWEGVRNYQARNFMRDDLKVGDQVLFYHSGTKTPGVAGIGEVAKDGYPDHTARDPKSKYFDPKATQEDPRWFMVDIAFVKRFEGFVPLSALRETAGLEKMPLLNRSRLSVQPVSEDEFNIILRLGLGK